MTVIEEFLGRRVEIPDDIRYHIKQGLWVKPQNDDLIFGLTEPALILAGGINGLDWLVSERQKVSEKDSIVFAITGKIVYIEAPASGTVYFNNAAKENSTLLLEDPYGSGWLFKINPEAEAANEFKRFATALDYIESLKSSEGFKNPKGLKGGVSGICKAVYTGIREQKI
jgi:glycine cleavage system H lipoate-binding protein